MTAGADSDDEDSESDLAISSADDASDAEANELRHESTSRTTDSCVKAATAPREERADCLRILCREA
jgi:hypothetical protein